MATTMRNRSKNSQGKTNEYPATEGDNMFTSCLNDEKSISAMSLEEKIALIDREINTIHHCFVRQGFTAAEIEHGARPILKCIAYANRKRWAIRLMKCLFVLLFAISLFYFDPLHTSMVIGARVAMVKTVYPYFDFSVFYREKYECLIPNQYYKVRSAIGESDCEMCEGLDYIPHAKNLTPEAMNEDFLRRNTPVIVTDALNEWPATKEFSIKKLAEIYTTNEVLKEVNGCFFSSNYNTKVKGNNRMFLMRAADGEFKQYYAHWENCLEDSGKQLRHYFKTPYFFPKSAMIDVKNWVFISSDYKAATIVPNPLTGVAPLIWYAQITGSSEIQLLPRSPCFKNKQCITIKETLVAGQILVYTDDMWNFDYKPGTEGMNIAIGGGGSYDS